jgi:hypothetical protein
MRSKDYEPLILYVLKNMGQRQTRFSPKKFTENIFEHYVLFASYLLLFPCFHVVRITNHQALS